jgi:hypothetical protein
MILFVQEVLLWDYHIRSRIVKGFVVPDNGGAPSESLIRIPDPVRHEPCRYPVGLSL